MSTNRHKKIDKSLYLENFKKEMLSLLDHEGLGYDKLDPWTSIFAYLTKYIFTGHLNSSEAIQLYGFDDVAVSGENHFLQKFKDNGVKVLSLWIGSKELGILEFLNFVKKNPHLFHNKRLTIEPTSSTTGFEDPLGNDFFYPYMELRAFIDLLNNHADVFGLFKEIMIETRAIKENEDVFPYVMSIFKFVSTYRTVEKFTLEIDLDKLKPEEFNELKELIKSQQIITQLHFWHSQRQDEITALILANRHQVKYKNDQPLPPPIIVEEEVYPKHWDQPRKVSKALLPEAIVRGKQREQFHLQQNMQQQAIAVAQQQQLQKQYQDAIFNSQQVLPIPDHRLLNEANYKKLIVEWKLFPPGRSDKWYDNAYIIGCWQRLVGHGIYFTNVTPAAMQQVLAQPHLFSSSITPTNKPPGFIIYTNEKGIQILDYDPKLAIAIDHANPLQPRFYTMPTKNKEINAWLETFKLQNNLSDTTIDALNYIYKGWHEKNADLSGIHNIDERGKKIDEHNEIVRKKLLASWMTINNDISKLEQLEPVLQKLSRSDLVNIGYILYEHGFEHLRLWFANLQVLDQAGLLDSYLAYKNKPIMLYIHGFTELADPESCFLMQQLSQLNENEKEWWKELSNQLPKNQYTKPKKNPYDDEYEARFYDFKANARAFLHFCHEMRKFPGKPLSLPYTCKMVHAHHLPTALDRLITILKSSNHPEQVLKEQISLSNEADYYAVMHDGFHFTCPEMELLQPIYTLADNAPVPVIDKPLTYKVSEKMLLDNIDPNAILRLTFRYWASIDSKLSLHDFRKINDELLKIAQQLKVNGNTDKDICQLYARLACFAGKSNANIDLILMSLSKINKTFTQTKFNTEHLNRFYPLLEELFNKPHLDIVDLSNLLQYLLADKQILNVHPDEIANQLKIIPMDMLIALARNNRPEKLSFFADMLQFAQQNKKYAFYIKCLPFINPANISHHPDNLKIQLPNTDISYLYPWLSNTLYQVLQEIDGTKVLPNINVFNLIEKELRTVDKSVSDTPENVKRFVRKVLIENYPGIQFRKTINSQDQDIYIYKNKSINKQLNNINTQINKIKNCTLIPIDLENCSIQTGIARAFNLYLAAKAKYKDIAKSVKNLIQSMLKELMEEREKKIKDFIKRSGKETAFLQKIVLQYLGKVEFDIEETEIDGYLYRYTHIESFLKLIESYAHNPKTKSIYPEFLAVLKDKLNQHEFKPLSEDFLLFNVKVLSIDNIDETSKLKFATYLLTTNENRKGMVHDLYTIYDFCQSMSNTTRNHVINNISKPLLIRLESIKKKLKSDVIFNQLLDALYNYFGSDNNAVLDILEATTKNVELSELSNIVTILIGLAKARTNIHEINTHEDWITFIKSLDKKQLELFAAHFTELPSLTLNQVIAIRDKKLDIDEIGKENEKNPFGQRDKNISENSLYAIYKTNKRIEQMEYLTDDKSNPFQPLPEKQKTFLKDSLNAINTMAPVIAKLSTGELIEQINNYKKHYASQHNFALIDNLKLIALLREIYYRSGTKPIYLNSMQTLALVQSIASESIADRSLILNLNTGQGKGAIAAIEAAYRTICGKTVDFTSSNKTLIQRDFKYNLNFFKQLKIPASLITERSRAKDYVVNGINFSEVGELALFRMQHRKRNAHVEPPVNERFIIVDEADHTHIYQNTAFISSVNTNSANFYNNPYQALYKSVYHYARYLQLIRNGTTNPAEIQELQNYTNEFGVINDANTIKSEVQFYRNYLKKHPELWQTRDNNNLPSLLRINELIRSAFVVCELKEKDDFIVKPVTKIINDREMTFSMAHILDENQMPLPDSRWTNGIHQILHARLSEINKNAIAEKTMPAFAFEQEARLEGTTTAGNFSRFYGPHLRGYTATPGSPKLIRYYNGAAIFKLPPQQERRLKFNLASVPANEEQFIQQLITKIKTNPNNPQLIVCGSIEEVDALKAIITKLLPQREIQTLTGQNIEDADSILEKAGKEGVITISNVLERGQDISVEQPYPKLLQLCKAYADLLEEEAFCIKQKIDLSEIKSSKKIMREKLLYIMQMHAHKLPKDLQKQINKFKKEITFEKLVAFIDVIERPLEEVYTTIADPQAIIQALGRTARQDNLGEFTPIINPAVIKREANVDTALLKTKEQKAQVLYGIQHSKEKKIKRDKAMNEIYGKHIIPVQNMLDKAYLNLYKEAKSLEETKPGFADKLNAIKLNIHNIKIKHIKELQLTWERLLDQYQENAFFNQKSWLNKLESEFAIVSQNIMQEASLELNNIVKNQEIEGTQLVKKCLTILEEVPAPNKKDNDSDYYELDTKTNMTIFRQSSNPAGILDRHIIGAIKENPYSMRFLKNIINSHKDDLTVRAVNKEYQSIAKKWLNDYKYIFISLDRRALANSLIEQCDSGTLTLEHINAAVLQSFDADKTRRRIKDSDFRNVLWQLKKLHYVKQSLQELHANIKSETVLLSSVLKYCKDDLTKNTNIAAANTIKKLIDKLENSKAEEFIPTLSAIIFGLKQIQDMTADKKVKEHYAKMVEYYEWLLHAHQANMKLENMQTHELPLAKIQVKLEQELKNLQKNNAHQKVSLWNKKLKPVNDPIIAIQFADHVAEPNKQKLIPAFNTIVSILGKYIDHRDIAITQENSTDANAHQFSIRFIHAGQSYKMQIAIDEKLHVNFLTDFVPEKLPDVRMQIK